MDYKFSVIIPVYNAEKTINRCLDSLLSQKQDNAEIILINDGSKDRSGEICREYASKHTCIVYIEQENAGASAARNAGLAVVTGEYITFVDSDDYVMDGYFAALDCSDAEFVVYSYRTIRSDGMAEYRLSQELLNAVENTDVILAVIGNRLASPWNKRFKRSIVEDHHLRFKKDLVIGEDFIFGLEYMLLCKSSRVDPAVLYCVDETGMDSITRAARYDLTQSLKIYDYAFKIAGKCKWTEYSKDMLLRQLDYQYCRTSFAVAGRYINASGKTRIKPGSLVQLFHDQYHPYGSTLNLTHLAMRLCVKYKILPAYCAVEWLHGLLFRK